MLMTNENVRLFPHDRLMARTFLRLIPVWVLPNHITIFRFFLIPFVLLLLVREQWGPMLALFSVAGFTDVIDGSLARTRKQITLWGTIADPVADKLLIGSVGLLYIVTHVSISIGIAIVLLELLIVGGAYIKHKKRGYMTANVFGKMKMFMQVVGVGLLVFAEFAHEPILVPMALAILLGSLAVGYTSFITYSF